MTEAIIVYRNPLEQRLWEGVMGSPNFILSIMGFAFAMFVSFLVIHWFLEKLMGTNNFRCRKNQYNVHIAGILSFLIGCLTMWWIL